MPGYQKFSSGLILQWGLGEAPRKSQSGHLLFPIPFPHACLAIVSNKQTAMTGSLRGDAVGVNSWNNTGYTVFAGDSASTVTWLAIGY